MSHISCPIFLQVGPEQIGTMYGMCRTVISKYIPSLFDICIFFSNAWKDLELRTILALFDSDSDKVNKEDFKYMLNRKEGYTATEKKYAF